MTARWAVDIAPQRDLQIVWEPISLFLKNNPDPESKFYETVKWSHGLLRVMEAVRAAEGDAKVFDLYWEYGRRIHHDQERKWDPAEALTAVGLDPGYAAAAEDESWDGKVRGGMDRGLALVGQDVGTPIISFEENGRTVANFGPVITRVPPGDDSLKLWDAFVTLTSMDGFWELKRTRTESPEFGARP
ncbi:MAG: disulfide bond formation protein DsbA [Acidimicrobiales bacterium]